MIGLDTNVLVRYIMQDDPAQSALASRLIESLTADSRGYVTVVSIVELYWVLTSSYDLGDEQARQALDMLLRAKELIVERAEVVLQALRKFANGKADFPDCLIACSATAAGCEQVMTFDVRASRHAGMTLLT